MKSYFLDKEMVAGNLKTDLIHGLSTQEVQNRKQKYGKNSLPVPELDSYISLFFKQFKDPLIYLLLVAATIIFFIESGRDALFITFILILNAAVGTYQEGKAGRILASLRQLMKTKTLVVRDNAEQLIDSQEIVPGDIVILQEGDFVPADIRLTLLRNFSINEAAITGESGGVKKVVTALKNDDGASELSLHQQQNIAFSGSYVLRGSARGVVLYTGLHTVMGGMQKIVATLDTKMPLKAEIERVAYLVLWYVLGILGLLFIIGWARGSSFYSLLSMLAALFICVVPEGLPVIFTLILAMGVRRMAKKNMLVKRLQAIEGLGHINILAIDKTGTLTRNELRVQDTYIPDGDQKKLFYTAAVMSQAYIDSEQVKGDSIDIAFSQYAHAHNIEKKEMIDDGTVIEELPFDYVHKVKISFLQRQNQFTSWSDDDLIIVLITGAPEVIMKICQDATLHDTVQKLDSFLVQGLRVVASAYICIEHELWQAYQKKIEQEEFAALAEQIIERGGCIANGLFGMGDTLREGVDSVVKRARSYGVKPVMITGDHALTAKSIAIDSGLIKKEDTVYEVVQSRDINKISAEEFEDITAFARVMPQEKQTILQRYKALGYTVGMTGDGVNDVPSLAEAHVSIAMGGIGTEVAKEAADIILLDDRLETIVNGISEGRHVFSLLKRVILYFFATNMAEILIIFFALGAGLALPLTAVQILWLNLVTDGLLTLALAMEPVSSESLHDHSLVQTKHLVDRSLLITMFYLAFVMGLGSIILFFIYQSRGIAYARTVALISMAFFQMWTAWTSRSKYTSLLHMKLFDNIYLVGASIIATILQVMIVYLPFLRNVFHTVAIDLSTWGIIFLVSIMIIITEELRKYYFAKKR